MILPKAPALYDAADQARLRRTLEVEDRRNLKAGAVFDQVLMRDSVTGAVVRLSVAGGSLVVT
jgi:hypothetical protein